jgi:hypothetical protein
VKKWLLLLAAVVGLGTMLVAWFAVEDARQVELLNAREVEADMRAEQAFDRAERLVQDGAPAGEIRQADVERERALAESALLRLELGQRQLSWYARLRAEVRRRTGW